MRWLVLIGGLVALDAGLVACPLGPVREGPFVAPVHGRISSLREERRGLDPVWMVEAILARPLFEPVRRAPGREQAVVGNPETMPRLTGIVMTDSTRQALFATPKGTARGEGDQLGAFTVTSIRAGAVDVAGPDGPRTLYLAADAGSRAELAAARPLAAIVGAEEREWRVENDQ